LKILLDILFFFNQKICERCLSTDIVPVCHPFLVELWCAMVMTPFEGSTAFESSESTVGDLNSVVRSNHEMRRPRRSGRANRVVGLRSIPPALQTGVEYHRPTAIAEPSLPLDGLEALKRLAKGREQQAEQARRDLGRSFVPSSGDALSHAAPLAPLRDRDTDALASWFGRDDMGAIEADIAHCLLVLWPAPCWEDNPFDFLEEFMTNKKQR